MAALAVCGLVSACSEYNTNLTIQTSSSSVAFLSPSTVSAGGSGFTITVNGAGFVTGAIIIWNVGATQTQLTTTLVSSVELTAPVPASLLTTAGTVQVAVQIPGSAASPTSNVYNTNTTEISNVVFFTIAAPPGPAPAVTSLSASTSSQASTPFCSATGITLTVNGTNFVNSSTVNGVAVGASTVNWNGSPRPTKYVSATQLTAQIPASDTAFSGTATVSVSNPAASASPGTSNSLPFTMTTPAPLAAPGAPTLSVTSASVGSPALTVTLTGNNILPCSVAQWVNGSAVTPLATTYIPPATGAASLSVTLPSSDFAAAGTAQVQIVNPAPGGGTSGGSAFTISAPAIASVTGSSTASCTLTGPTLTVTGTNFVNISVVNWNGSPRATTFVSTTQLTAQLTSADVAFQGTQPVTVSTGSVTSTSFSFAVTTPAALPVPAISSVLPANATAGTAGITLAVTGGNFLPCSLVQWNGVNLPTTFDSTTHQLATLVPATNILSVGTAQVTVFNPTAGGGGGASLAAPFPIVAPTITSLSASTTSANSAPACGLSGIALTVNGANYVNGLTVNWNGSPRPTKFVSSTQLVATLSVADSAFPGTAAVTVSSSTTTSNTSTFTLSAPGSLPAPAIASLTPSNAAAGNPGFLLGINGSSWVPCTVVQWNGSGRTTLFVGTTGGAAAISAADIATGNITVQITGVSPSPGGGTSNAVAFPIFTTPGLAGGLASAAGDLATPTLSADSRYAVFVLASADGVTEIPGSIENIFVSDTCTGVSSGCTPSTTLESNGISNNPADGNSISPSISADGRYVAFISSATNLVAGDNNGAADVFVRDTCAGVASGCTPSTQRVSVATSGTQANGASSSAAINGGGRYVTFRSAATNLDPASSATTGLFLRDTCAGVASGCTPSTQQLQ
ncbi:MAG: hypothetical protein LAO19_04125 [Acidobacteriia bacterium]|nr:hypothetical protein [Terriglobia bacterium]